MKDIAIFLYSKSDIMARPWADAGIECHLFDLELTTGVKGNIHQWGGFKNET